jgi:predicted Fe-Mo cluster-binding NifX family protein
MIKHQLKYKEGTDIMKIAFTTSGDNLEALLDSRFGRAPKFLIYDPETKIIEVIDNKQNLNAVQGAGIQSASMVAQSGAQVLVTGHCGPKAFQVLKAAGIKVYNTDAPTVAEALKRYQAGQLAEAKDSDVEGHWV